MKHIRPILLAAAILLHGFSASGQDVQDVPDPDPEYELEQLNVAEGYEVNLFASEPMIAKPVAMAWDERGRLWVVGTTSYPQIVPGQIANDKVIVLEDTDGDGRADKSTVFADGLHMPTGVAPGDGGVYVGNSTELLHLKDTDGDGEADERRVVFRGFGQDDTHHLINTFRWGPGGQLYINQGIYTYSNVETPWGPRRLHGAGIWRAEPEQLRLEVFTRGMWNPWGHAFDEWGQSFATDGAGGEGINYAFPGAQFVAAVGAERTIEGLNPGHPKYAGLEILSGRHLPDSLQGHLLTNDFRANRVNRFVVTGAGSGYRSEEAGPLLWTQHVAFRPVDVQMGPDGAIYLADWYNPIIQHGEIDFRDPRRDHKHGRIWRITARDRPLVEPPNLAGAATVELLDALRLPEAWTRRQARRLLRERGADDVSPALTDWANALNPADEDHDRLLLEALWVSQSVGIVDSGLLRRVLHAQEPRARAAAVRVLYHWNDLVDGADEMLARAVSDEHPRVRLEAVTALRERRSAEAARTALDVLDAPMDRFLDYALWKTTRDLEPFWLDRLKASPGYFESDRKLAYALKTSNDPYTVERLTGMLDAGEVPAEYHPDVLDAVADYGSPQELQIIFEQALVMEDEVAPRLAALERAAQHSGARADDLEPGSGRTDEDGEDQGRRPVEGLERIERLITDEDDEVAASAVRLAGYWDLTDLRSDLVEMAEGAGTSSALREATVEALAAMGDATSVQAVVDMTRPDRPLELRLIAAATLPEVDLEKAAETAAAMFGELPDDADPSGVFRSLFSHEDGPQALADALENAEMPPAVARAGLEVMRSRGWRWISSNEYAPIVQTALEEIGGPLPPPRVPQDPSPGQIDRMELDVKAQGNAVRGERIYRRSELACQTCHAIGGAGGRAGPDLSSLGASAPVDYIIEAVLMPDNSVKDGYSLMNVTKTDGSVVSGMPLRETGDEIVLRNLADEEVSIPMNQVQERAIVPGSLMPAGLTAQLEEDEFLDLIRFMSELGATEEFTPESGWVRRWRAAAGTEAARTALGEHGLSAFAAENSDRLSWQPRYSTVSGALPLDDLPVVEGSNGPSVSAARFEIEVERAGEADLELSGVEGLTIWVESREVTPLRETVTLDLSEGTHQLTVVVDRDAREEPLAIRILDGSSAQVQPVLGK